MERTVEHPLNIIEDIYLHSKGLEDFLCIHHKLSILAIDPYIKALNYYN
jgi:hypothetical protein